MRGIVIAGLVMNQRKNWQNYQFAKEFIFAKMTGKSARESNEPRQMCLQEMDRIRRDRVDTAVRTVDVCARHGSQKS
jgi:hypothetical protein